MFINIILFLNDMLENKMLLIGIVAAVVIIAGVAGFLLMKKPVAPTEEVPTEAPPEETAAPPEEAPTQPVAPTVTEADKITNVPEEVTGEQTVGNVYYFSAEATGRQTTFNIGNVGLNLDTSTNKFELQILLSKERITLTDAGEIADRIITRLSNFASDLTKEVVEGEQYYKIIIRGTATDVDGLKAEVKSYTHY